MYDTDSIKVKLDEIYRTMRDEIVYSLGCRDFAEYMHDYYDGKEPIYPSEINRILDEYFEDIEVSECIRRELLLED